jgi:hypothetical protein
LGLVPSLHALRLNGGLKMPSSKVSWWLDWSALPERRLWARLDVSETGQAEVLDCDGRRHSFPGEDAAILWLLEDEYSRLETLIEEGEVPVNLAPPCEGQWS